MQISVIVANIQTNFIITILAKATGMGVCKALKIVVGKVFLRVALM